MCRRHASATTAAERVVDEELHDVARREELVAHGQLAAVARRLALVAHLLALVAAVEVLVDPTDRLVLAPDARELWVVEDREQLVERLPPRPDQARRITAIEEDPDLLADLVEQALEVEAISLVGELDEPRREPAELPEARRLVALETHSWTSSRASSIFSATNRLSVVNAASRR